MNIADMLLLQNNIFEMTENADNKFTTIKENIPQTEDDVSTTEQIVAYFYPKLSGKFTFRGEYFFDENIMNRSMIVNIYEDNGTTPIATATQTVTTQSRSINLQVSTNLAKAFHKYKIGISSNRNENIDHMAEKFISFDIGLNNTTFGNVTGGE